MSESQEFVIVGGGIPGILAAHQLKALNPESKVMLLEASDALGGLYRSYFLSEINAWVDLGMHVYYETGKENYDSLIRSVLMPEEWSDMEGNQKDLCGIYWRGRLRFEHPYPDLRNESFLLRMKAFLGIVAAVLTSKWVKPVRSSSEHTAIRQFGLYTYRQTVLPILRKLYRADPSDLSDLALRSPELRRVALFGPVIVRVLSVFPGLKSRIAYPDQFDMPLRRRPQAGLYPRELGFGRQVIERLRDILVDAGVEIRLGNQVLRMDNSDIGGISLVVNGGSGGEYPIQCRKVVWCAPIFPLIRSAGYEEAVTIPTLSKPRSKYFLTALMRGHNPISPLYYFYVYDDNLSTFRITNYAGYSGASALNPSEFLLGVELWLDEEMSEAHLCAKAAEELEIMGMVNKNCSLVRIWVLPEKAPPFEPTIEIEKFFTQSVGLLTEHFQGNLICSGPFARPGLFFLQDVLRDLHNQLEELNA